MFPFGAIKQEEEILKNEVKEEEKEIKEESIDNDGVKSNFFIPEFELYAQRMAEIEAVKREEEEEDQDSRKIHIQEVIKSVIEEVRHPAVNQSNLELGLFAVYSGSSLAAACRTYDLNLTTLSKYSKKVHAILGSLKDRKKVDTGTITIDGITVPRSMSELIRLISKGEVTMDQARPFDGTREQMKEKVIEILRAFKVSSDVINQRAKAVEMVNVDGFSTSEASRQLNISRNTAFVYSKIVKIFIQFGHPVQSSCTSTRMIPPSVVSNQVCRVMNGIPRVATCTVEFIDTQETESKKEEDFDVKGDPNVEE
ncbi:hypothetical protein PFISCL1PPCAC_962 [Pristionchus fissidentatus]|uniref:HTH psq-type domain-containing protein n=1 Tax=Pristionchus fissidentatus TaxID=1538716 RepID=A0AAV5UR66_9BILA|nr:hypothetical protein PFISCL1PPCAC_962 [Pristionchus fissidentatus]